MKKQLTISLDKAREIYAKGDDTMNSLLLETFSKEELEEKEVKSWEDLGNIEGYVVEDDENGEIEIFKTRRECLTKYPSNKLIWVTEEQAKACLAMSQLSQLMKHYNGDWEPDWTSVESKYCILIFENRIKKDKALFTSVFLSFPTPEIRDRFLENHRDLIEQAKPLL